MSVSKSKERELALCIHTTSCARLRTTTVCRTAGWLVVVLCSSSLQKGNSSRGSDGRQHEETRQTAIMAECACECFARWWTRRRHYRGAHRLHTLDAFSSLWPPPAGRQSLRLCSRVHLHSSMSAAAAVALVVICFCAAL